MRSSGLSALLREVMSKRINRLGLGRSLSRIGPLAAVFAAYAAAAVSIYLAAGLGGWSPAFQPIPQNLALAVGFFFLPSLAEELLWRWLLISPRCFSSTARATRGVLLSSLIFTAAHPLAAWVFVPHAWELFSRPAFLVIVFLLGVACGAAYVVSRSLWPPVVIHWLTVLAWKFLLGGPFVLLGR